MRNSTESIWNWKMTSSFKRHHWATKASLSIVKFTRDFSHSHARAIVDFNWCRARLQLKCIERKKKPFIPEMRAFRSNKHMFLFSSPRFGCAVRAHRLHQITVFAKLCTWIFTESANGICCCSPCFSLWAYGSIREMFVLRNFFALLVGISVLFLKIQIKSNLSVCLFIYSISIWLLTK